MKALFRNRVEVLKEAPKTAMAIDDLVSAINVPPFETAMVKFPAVQQPSTNPYTLDDYQEGTWTPIDVSGATLAFTLVSGTYIKIGRLVFFQTEFTYPVTGSGAAAVIGGLPFVAGQNGTAVDRFPPSAGFATVYRFIRKGTTSFNNYLASGASYTNAQFSSTSHYLSGQYESAL